MTDAELGALSAMKAAWMTGNPALSSAPAPWRSIGAGDGSEGGELHLLAIAGQALQVACRPVMPGDLRARPDLPDLGHAILHEPVRAPFRRTLKSADGMGRTRQLLALLAKRGFVAHPSDWLPASANSDVPELYAPWLDWVGSIEPSGERASDQLDDDTWDLFYPAERLTLLRGMRMSRPDEALVLIAGKSVGMPADKRLQLVELLSVNLRDADTDFLESLSSDRSGKVRTAAAALLARLGKAHSGEVESELAGFIRSKTSGVLRRQSVLAPTALKTAAQRGRRQELFEQASFEGLSAAIGLSGEEVVGQWRFGSDEDADMSLVELVGRTASDDLAGLLFDRLMQATSPSGRLLAAISARLDEASRLRAAALAMSGRTGPCADALACAGDSLGWMESDLVLGSAAWKDLKANIKKAEKQGGGQRASMIDSTISVTLLELSLLASKTCAQALLSELETIGLHAADPKLDPLRLNAALHPLEDALS